MISPYWVKTCEKGFGALTVEDTPGNEQLDEKAETEDPVEPESPVAEHEEGGDHDLPPEEPIVEQEPVAEEEPVTFEEPVAEEGPVAEEEPVTFEEPVAEEEPVTFEEPFLASETESTFEENGQPEALPRKISNRQRKEEFASWRSSVRKELDDIRQEVKDLLGR